jgi:hypothetical protein
MNLNIYSSCDLEKLYKITLKCDMKFLFCMKEINNGYVESLLFDDNIEIKQSPILRLNYVNELINNEYDGWFSIIEGSPYVLEICLCFDIYNNNKFDIQECDDIYIPIELKNKIQISKNNIFLKDQTDIDILIKNNTVIKEIHIGEDIKIMHNFNNINNTNTNDINKNIKTFKRMVKKHFEDKRKILENERETRDASLINNIFVYEYIIFPHLKKLYNIEYDYYNDDIDLLSGSESESELL